MNTTNKMTLGGAKKNNVLKKGPGCQFYSNKHNQYLKITNGLTLGGAKEPMMLRKGLGCWSILGRIINIEKGVKTINGMTLGGPKATIMLRKTTWVLGLLQEA